MSTIENEVLVQSKTRMKLEVGALGERLIQLRLEKGLSLSAVAESADIAKSYLAKLERGEVPNPGLKTLDSVAKALDVTLAHLLAPEARSRSNVTPQVGRAELLRNVPRSLREFIDQIESQEAGELPVDVIQSLVVLQFRGRRPETLDDWRFVYEALKRSTR